MNIVGFDFNGSSVRTVLQEDGELFWVAKDVCDVLGVNYPSVNGVGFLKTPDYCQDIKRL